MKYLHAKLVTALSFIILFSFTISGCADKRPPYYGGFLRDGRDLVEIPDLELFGIPTLDELTDVPSVSESQPVFVLWQQYIQLDYLSLFSIDMKEELQYHALPVGDGIYELQPAKPLALGYYCYIQGDPLKVFLPGWCFKVSSTRQTISGSTSHAEISVAEAYKLYPDNAFFLDVREVVEWEAGRVPDTTNIPLSELESRLGELPKDQDIVVICRSGNRSAEGRVILLDAGFENVTSMEGGVSDWKDAGYPYDGEILR